MNALCIDGRNLALAKGSSIATCCRNLLVNVRAIGREMKVDPYDVAALPHAIRTLDGDAGLRDELVIKKRLRVTRFSPQAYQGRFRERYGKVGLF